MEDGENWLQCRLDQLPTMLAGLHVGRRSLPVEYNGQTADATASVDDLCQEQLLGRGCRLRCEHWGAASTVARALIVQCAGLRLSQMAIGPNSAL